MLFTPISLMAIMLCPAVLIIPCALAYRIAKNSAREEAQNQEKRLQAQIDALRNDLRQARAQFFATRNQPDAVEPLDGAAPTPNATRELQTNDGARPKTTPTRVAPLPPLQIAQRSLQKPPLPEPANDEPIQTEPIQNEPIQNEPTLDFTSETIESAFNASAAPSARELVERALKSPFDDDASTSAPTISLNPEPIDESTRENFQETPREPARETTPATQPEETPQPQPQPERRRLTFAEQLELGVGRKLFAWTAVALFLLGGAFFAQAAIKAGLLNPTNRCIGLTLLGAVFLALGRFLFRKGMRAYSAAMTSSGVLTIMTMCAYANWAEVAPHSYAILFVFASVFGGFALGALYRSGSIGLATTLGGACAAALVFNYADETAARSTSLPAIYFACYYGGAALLANWIKRSHFLAVAWVAAPLVFFGTTHEVGLGAEYFRSAAWFLAAFFAIDAVDLFALLLSPRRRISVADAFRAFATPLFVYFTFRHMCATAPQDVDFLGALVADAARAWQKILAFAFFALYAVALALYRARAPQIVLRTLDLRENERFAPEKLARSAMTATRGADLKNVMTLDAIVFLTIGTALVATRRFGLACAAIFAVGLFLVAARKRVAYRPPKFVESIEPESRKRATLAALYASDLRASRLFNVCSVLFFALAATLIVAELFSGSLNDVSDLLDFSRTPAALRLQVPFFNARAFPIFLASAALIAAVAARIKRFLDPRPLIKASASEPASQRALSIFHRALSATYASFGGCAMLILAAYEIFAFVDAIAYSRGSTTPGVVGICAVALVWACVALALYLVGWRRDARGARKVAAFLLMALALKLFAMHLACHQVFLGHAVPLLLTPPAATGNLPSEAINSVPNAFAAPLVNAFSLPFVATAAVALLIGVVGARSRKSSFTRDEANLSTAAGYVGALLFVAIATADVYGQFSWRPEKYGEGHFWAQRAVWILWTVLSLAFWGLGRVFKSFPTRVGGYLLLAATFPWVLRGEFLSGAARVNGANVDGFFNVYALPAWGYFLALIALGSQARKVASGKPGEVSERAVMHGFGAVGLACVATLLSFETVRYFTGKTWFGPGDWTPLLALSTLWTIGIALFLALAAHYRSRVYFAFGCALFAALVGKYFIRDVAATSEFTIPFFNSFGASTFILFGTALGIVWLARSRAKLAEGADASGAKLLRAVGTCALAFALAQLWFGTSRDVFRCARLYASTTQTEPALVAQTALTALWTVLASAALAVGFAKREPLLRWFAIALFGFTTLKVLTVDMASLDSIYRVIAFFAVAIALSIAAYKYNRFKTGSEPTSTESQDDAR